MSSLQWLLYRGVKLQGLVVVLCLNYAELGLAWEKSIHKQYKIGDSLGLDYFEVRYTRNELTYGGVEAEANLWPHYTNSGDMARDWTVRVGGGYRTSIGQDMIGGANAFVSIKGNLYSGLEMVYDRWEGVLNFKNLHMLELGASYKVLDKSAVGVYFVPKYWTCNVQPPIVVAIDHFIRPDVIVKLEASADNFSIGLHFNPSVRHSSHHKQLWPLSSRGGLREGLRSDLI